LNAVATLWPQLSPWEVPVSVALAIAQDINALIAPHVPYGLTDILGQYPGRLYIPPDVFRSYLRAVLVDWLTTGSGIL